MRLGRHHLFVPAAHRKIFLVIDDRVGRSLTITEPCHLEGEVQVGFHKCRFPRVALWAVRLPSEGRAVQLLGLEAQLASVENRFQAMEVMGSSQSEVELEAVLGRAEVPLTEEGNPRAMESLDNYMSAVVLMGMMAQVVHYSRSLEELVNFQSVVALVDRLQGRVALSPGRENFQLLVVAAIIIWLGRLTMVVGDSEVASEARVVVGLAGVIIMTTPVPQVNPMSFALGAKGRGM